MAVGRVKLFALVLAAGAMVGSGTASAQSVGGGLRIDRPGAGLEVETLFSDRFGIRGSLNGVLGTDFSEAGIRYDSASQLGSGFLLADWHPYASGFRLSGGLAYNNQRFAGIGQRAVAPINSGELQFSSAQIGSLDGRAALSRASPYVGLGWGLRPGAGSRLYFSADLGVMYQRPSATLIGNCGFAFSAGVCNQLHHDVRAEDAELRDATDDFRFYPVISVGFGLRF